MAALVDFWCDAPADVVDVTSGLELEKAYLSSRRHLHIHSGSDSYKLAGHGVWQRTQAKLLSAIDDPVASNMMLQVNLRAFRHHMISSHHRYPVPTAVKRRQHCTMDNGQLDLRSYLTIRAPNVSRSVASHVMNTSNEMLLYTVEEPVECVLSVLTMSDQILSDKSFAVDSADFFVFIEDILKHAVRIVDNVLLVDMLPFHH